MTLDRLQLSVSLELRRNKVSTVAPLPCSLTKTVAHCDMESLSPHFLLISPKWSQQDRSTHTLHYLCFFFLIFMWKRCSWRTCFVWTETQGMALKKERESNGRILLAKQINSALNLQQALTQGTTAGWSHRHRPWTRLETVVQSRGSLPWEKWSVMICCYNSRGQGGLFSSNNNWFIIWYESMNQDCCS